MIAKSVLSGLKIGVIGAGNMGQALVRALVEKSVYPQNIWVYDIDTKKTAALKKESAVKIAKSSRQSVSLSDVVILAVKPQVLPDAAKEISSAIAENALIISIAAGVPILKLESFFKKRVPVIRVMPNMPAQVGCGMSAYSLGRAATAKHQKVVEAILGSFGDAVQVPERMLDLVTAVSGSGPAYFFLLAEKLIEAAYELGMKVDMAKRLVYQTALGSARVLVESQEDPEDLVGRVASKGGTTEAALKVFQKKGFGKIVQDAVKAACRRSRELKEGK
jgi:pyrroline-5-carboxylate reductase